jgi:hypothetical protein
MGFQGSQVLAAFDGGETVHVRQYQMVLVQKAIKENVRALTLHPRSPRPLAAGPVPRARSRSTRSLDRTRRLQCHMRSCSVFLHMYWAFGSSLRSVRFADGRLCCRTCAALCVPLDQSHGANDKRSLLKNMHELCMYIASAMCLHNRVVGRAQPAATWHHHGFNLLRPG